jgi:hypothetical protein
MHAPLLFVAVCMTATGDWPLSVLRGSGWLNGVTDRQQSVSAGEKYLTV